MDVFGLMFWSFIFLVVICFVGANIAANREARKITYTARRKAKVDRLMGRSEEEAAEEDRKKWYEAGPDA